MLNAIMQPELVARDHCAGSFDSLGETTAHRPKRIRRNFPLRQYRDVGSFVRKFLTAIQFQPR